MDCQCHLGWRRLTTIVQRGTSHVHDSRARIVTKCLGKAKWTMRGISMGPNAAMTDWDGFGRRPYAHLAVNAKQHTLRTGMCLGLNIDTDSELYEVKP